MADSTRREKIETMLEQDPRDAFLRYALAMEHVGEGNDAAALLHFDRLLADNPDYVPGYFQSAQALVRLERRQEARQQLERGIAVARRTGDLHAAQEMQELLLTLA
jgi:tetratricopeptide (TPR) repeat protein